MLRSQHDTNSKRAKLRLQYDLRAELNVSSDLRSNAQSYIILRGANLVFTLVG